MSKDIFKFIYVMVILVTLVIVAWIVSTNLRNPVNGQEASPEPLSGLLMVYDSVEAAMKEGGGCISVDKEAAIAIYILPRNGDDVSALNWVSRYVAQETYLRQYLGKTHTVERWKEMETDDGKTYFECTFSQHPPTT